MKKARTLDMLGNYDERPQSPPPSYTPTKPDMPPTSAARQRRIRASPAPRDHHNLDLTESPSDGTAPASHHPQVAVVLGIHRYWRRAMQTARLVSMGPAVYWAFRCAWILFPEIYFGYVDGTALTWDLYQRLKVAQLLLAALWCSASAYLAFFFTDCLMTRWLVNYTPPATVVRLVSLNMVNVFSTSKFLNTLVSLGPGNTNDYRLLLPGWVCIALTLTILYHLTHRQTNIRRETHASIRVFWICSFISMSVLIVATHLSFEHSSIPVSHKLAPGHTERAPDYKCICNCPVTTVVVPPLQLDPQLEKHRTSESLPLPTAALEGLWEWLEQWRRNDR